MSGLVLDQTRAGFENPRKAGEKFSKFPPCFFEKSCRGGKFWKIEKFTGGNFRKLKNSRGEKFQAKKKFGGKNFRPKKSSGEKILGQKKYRRKNFCPKKSLAEKFLLKIKEFYNKNY